MEVCKAVNDLRTVEQWDMFELELPGPSEGNPFHDVMLKAVFTLKEDKEVQNSITVMGFYDGNGIYRIRFMPQHQGTWSYVTSANSGSLDGITGEFVCTAPSNENHGMVRVANKYHFAFDDGSRYYPFGTTCYAWIHQGDELEEETLRTLKKSPFNKVRMCVFPKNYVGNSNEPQYYPFEKREDGTFDFTRFSPEFFRHLEERLMQLQGCGIQADLILFHPYDKGRWGFDSMLHEIDRQYLSYLIARIASYRNVWWSMANEYDYVTDKTKEDWEDLIAFTAESDPYHHLLSIHNGDVLYDHWNPHITHASVQIGTVKAGFGRFRMLRDAYHKPVIYDEVGYEGNLEQRWGCLEPQQLVDKFWQGIISGTYVTHGETFTHPQDIIWWAKGGTLRGESPERIAFLKKIIEESGTEGLEPADRWWIINGVSVTGQYYLYYFGYETPTEWSFELPAMKQDIPIGAKFKVDVIDTWNMTIEEVSGTFEITDKERYRYYCSYHRKVALPGRPFMAVRVRRITE